ncbi:PREDICTED: bZIP transcription factor 2-like [Ipomoea nil]|uniref:bZIP transcription factor 2-like n=1 Tax=Ipomoea nil TaxID=35883 RepID=UPI000900DDCD|nr:PREDICTED: bZIP transcription factor 2-like [Ipomoea nil]
MMFGEDAAAMVDDYDFSSSEIQQLLSVSSDTSSPDEKKRKRRILNRESARRSRLRKKMQLEKLNEQAKLLAVENRELKRQLFVVAHRYQLVRTETNRLLSEAVILKRQLDILSRRLFLAAARPRLQRVHYSM